MRARRGKDAYGVAIFESMRVEFMVAHGHITRRWRQSLAALVSIVLGVAALITVLSVTNGFQADLADRVVGLTSHMVVLPLTELSFLEPQEILSTLGESPLVLGAAPGLSTQALLSFGNLTRSVQIRGIVPEAEGEISPALRKLTVGSLDRLTIGSTLLGVDLADWLGCTLDDEIWITFPSGQTRRFRVAGIFDSGVAQYDDSFAYLSLFDVQEVLALPNGVGEIRVRLLDAFSADEVAERLRTSYRNIEIVTWRELNRSLFDALVLEKRVFAFVLLLMLVVAGFGIANVMGMHVLERQRDIAILSTIGLSLRRIRYTFVLEGAFFGVVGSLAGCALGLVLSWLIGVFGLPLPGDLYPVDQVPVQIRGADIALALFGGVIVSLLASYFPARRISTATPVEVLRHG